MKLKITFHNSINDLTISQFMKVVPILNNLNEDNVDELIPIFTNVTIDQLDFNARNIIYQKIQTIDYTLQTGYTNILLSAYTLQDFDTMTFGEYIDLKSYYKDIFSNLDKIIATVYRKKKKYKFEDVADRIKLFKDVTIGEVAGVIQLFNNFDQELDKLSLKNKDDYMEEFEEEDERQKHIKRWGFFITIDHLADGKLINYKKVLKLGVKDVFIYYTFKTLDEQIKSKVI